MDGYVCSSTRGRSVEGLTLVTGILSVTVGDAGDCVVVLAWVTTGAKLVTGADVVVSVIDSGVVVRPDSVVCSVYPVVVVSEEILVVVVSLETVVIFSVYMVVCCVVIVVSVLV